MLETHTVLRADTTALFERLREANIMLQEVLSGAHENMGALENTLMLRVSEFVTTMNEIAHQPVTPPAASRPTSPYSATLLRTSLPILVNWLASSIFTAATLRRLSKSSTTAISAPRTALTNGGYSSNSLVATLDIRTEDLEKRLSRFSGLLDESLEAASTRAREVARLVSESSAEGTRAISDNTSAYAKTRRKSATGQAEAMRALYQQSAGDTETIFRSANERFAEAVQGMKQMAAEMQRELETTRNELRRGVFELPQETAESAAQMRRVIVDQIEALAELNRIVARHGRSLDAVEPVRRVARGAYACRSSAAAAKPRRAMMSAAQ